MANLVLLGALILPGCVTPAVDPVPLAPPAWFIDAHKSDHSHLYFKEIGESQVGPAEARVDSRRRLEISVRDYILDQSDARFSGAKRQETFSLTGLEIFHEAPPRQEGAQWRVYMLGRLPRAEEARILARINRGREIQQMWTRAQSLVSAGQQKQAIPLLERTITAYDTTLDVAFRKVDAEWLLAQACLQSGDSMRARRVLVGLQSSNDSRLAARASEKLKQLPQPGPKDYFHGLSVVLVTGQKNAGKVAPCPELKEELRSRLLHDGYTLKTPSADISALVNAGMRSGSFSDLKDAVGGDVILLAILDVNKEKFGTTVTVWNTETPAIDTALYYYVIEGGTGAVLVSGKTQIASNGNLSSAIAGLSSTMLTHRNHLPASAHLISAIAAQKGETR